MIFVHHPCLTNEKAQPICCMHQYMPHSPFTTSVLSSNCQFPTVLRFDAQWRAGSKWWLSLTNGDLQWQWLRLVKNAASTSNNGQPMASRLRALNVVVGSCKSRIAMNYLAQVWNRQTIDRTATDLRGLSLNYGLFPSLKSNAVCGVVFLQK